MGCDWGLKPQQKCETCQHQYSCGSPQFLSLDSLDDRVKMMEMLNIEPVNPRYGHILREFNQLKYEVQQLTGLVNHLRNEVAEVKAKKWASDNL